MQDILSNRDWPDPTSIEEAEKFRKELVEIVQSMQNQLGSRNRTEGNPYGPRMGSQEYWQWRQRASDALKFRLIDLRRIKAWIRNYHDNQHREGKDAPTDLTDVETIIAQGKASFGAMVVCLDTLHRRYQKLEEENHRLRERLGLSLNEEV